MVVANCTTTHNVRCRSVNGTAHLKPGQGHHNQHHSGNHSLASDYEDDDSASRDWWFLLVFVAFLFSLILLILGCRLLLLNTAYGKTLTAYMYERMS